MARRSALESLGFVQRTVAYSWTAPALQSASSCFLLCSVTPQQSQSPSPPSFSPCARSPAFDQHIGSPPEAIASFSTQRKQEAESADAFFRSAWARNSSPSPPPEPVLQLGTLLGAAGCPNPHLRGPGQSLGRSTRGISTYTPSQANMPPGGERPPFPATSRVPCPAGNVADAQFKGLSWERGDVTHAAAASAALATEGPGVACAAAGAGASPNAGSSARDRDPGARLKDIRRADLIFQAARQPKSPSADLSGLRFGAQFSQHMLQIAWSRGHGWGAPLITPVEPIPLHPAAQVLHYGMSCFEGMKAYKARGGGLRLFRPEKNMHRFWLSCHRLNLPTFDQGELLECIKELLRVESEWVPQRDGFSMYLRPTMMATTPFLGVGPPSDAVLLCLLSPAGPYFPDGLKPIQLLVDTQNVRAFPGGVGDRKVAGNYAPTILPQVEAAKRGCSQVLYVLRDRRPGTEGGAGEGDGDAEEDGLVGESGAMNIFFLMRKRPPPPSSLDGRSSPPGEEGEEAPLELVTPPLDGLILPGVTRASVLELVKEWEGHTGIEVSERPIRLKELRAAHEEGRLLEIFGTGTAVIVQPISALVVKDGTVIKAPVDEAACAYWTNLEPGTAHLRAAAGAPFSVTGRIYRALLDIQYGHREHPWSVHV